MLGNKKVYFNENNQFRIGNQHEVTYNPGLGLFTNQMNAKVSNPDITDDDIRNLH